VLAGFLLGCGGGSSTSSSATKPVSPAASVDSSASSNADAVAYVDKTPIAKSIYTHWLAVEEALGASGNKRHLTLGFLLTAQWVFGEAASRRISASDRDIHQRLAEIEKRRFANPRDLRKFMAASGETENDLLTRAKIEILRSRIADQVVAAQHASPSAAVLASFEQAFHRRWKSLTRCNAAYVMDDCSEYRGATASHSASSTPAQSASSANHTSAPSASHIYYPSSHGVNAEVAPPRAGAMTLSSPVFERNGAMPSEYTCDGGNTSPPLEWTSVSAQAKALVLFVIDDTSGPAGGFRWVVGNIDPSSKGVAAGKVPPGGIVGANSEGHAGYGGICPTRGATRKVEFLLYALRRKLSLTTGFSAKSAEREYGINKLILGEPAITYAGYRRP
jgi:Raf kinase inhibitor-like YbhB/YbcL family protein